MFLIPFMEKGCDLRRAGIVVLIVSFASFARAPVLSQGRISDLEEDAMCWISLQGKFGIWQKVESCEEGG